jgi:hypothetical protein
MIEPIEEQELKDRLSLIETMIAEGRQRTESWGWAFVLWGIAYYVAIGWAYYGNPAIAWPVTMIGTSILTAVIGANRNNHHPDTTLSRAISSIWIALGISLFLYCFSASMSGHAEQRTFLAVIEAMIGGANAASSLILKWKTQFACAVAWWIAAVLSSFVTVSQSSYIFLGAIFIGQIVFGVYMMISEAKERKQSVAHA